MIGWHKYKVSSNKILICVNRIIINIHEKGKDKSQEIIFFIHGDFLKGRQSAAADN